MSPFLRTCVLLVSGFVLCGCFTSETPLITADISVTPVRDGYYAYLDSEKMLQEVYIGHKGKVTTLTTEPDTDNDKDTNLLIYPVPKPGYYAVMGDTRMYTLIRVMGDSVIEFEPTDYCSQIQVMLADSGRDPAKARIAVTKGGKDTSDLCSFSRLGDMLGAFGALIDDGRLRPVRMYTPR